MPPEELPQDPAKEPRAEAPEDGGEAARADEVDFAAYVFPDTAQRRYTAVILWVIAAGAVALYVTEPGGKGWITAGALAGGIVLALLGLWFWFAGWRMRLDQEEALIEATKQISFGVGHAAANLGWRGWLSRPPWRILLYSAEEPPDMRGFVELDAVDGTVFEVLEESNPEDWERLRQEEDERPA
ncbi:MAG: hypothetical protein DYH08_10890 [Actinobacteria bacterium ATB1]|nr:hypothetical protein [Actinobacteria bacterium ATB1]